MTKIFNCIAVAGALLLLNGAVAFAQSSEMKVDVPFAFQTPTSQLPAGKYFIAELSGTRSAPFYRVQNAETGTSVILVAPISAYRNPVSMAELKPQVSFKCAEGVCGIAEIFGVGAQYGHTIPVKLRGVTKTAQLATVTIPGSPAE